MLVTAPTTSDSQRSLHHLIHNRGPGQTLLSPPNYTPKMVNILVVLAVLGARCWWCSLCDPVLNVPVVYNAPYRSVCMWIRGWASQRRDIARRVRPNRMMTTTTENVTEATSGSARTNFFSASATGP